MSAVSLQILIFIRNLLVFPQKFCDHIENNKEENYQSKNDQPFDTLCRDQKISDKPYCNHYLGNPVPSETLIASDETPDGSITVPVLVPGSTFIRLYLYV